MNEQKDERRGAERQGAERRGADRRGDGFALLLPVYAGDRADFLRLAFESSVQKQTLRPGEVLLVQDGPVDSELTTEINRLRRESPVPVNHIVLAENKGLCEALNIGLMASSFNVIARIDADDFSVPERFERQWAKLCEGFDLVGTGMADFDSDPEQTAVVRVPPVGADRIRAHARTHNPFNHPTVMYRLEALERVGAYEPFGKMEDYWLWVRLLNDGARVENIADALVRYRSGAGAFERRGGLREAVTEWRLQGKLLRMKFITLPQYLRNIVMKGAYRLMPAWLKRRLFARFIADGLPGDKTA